MALTQTQEAQVIQLINQQSALLSLATNEPTITSKLSATKVNLSGISVSTAMSDTDLCLVRQGTADKSITGALIKAFATNSRPGHTFATNDWIPLGSGLVLQFGTGNFIGASDTTQTINFPTAFSTAGLVIVGTSGAIVGGSNFGFEIVSPSQYKVGYHGEGGASTAGTGYSWMAVGR